MRVISVLALGLLGPGSVLASVCKPSPASSASPSLSSLSSPVSSSASSSSPVSSSASSSISILSSVPSSSSISSVSPVSSSASSSAAAQPTCGVNILSNGNFVSTYDWTFVDVTGAGSFTTETNGPAGYSTYLQYATTAAGTSYMYTTFITVPGTTYSLDYAYECTSDIGITGIHAQLSQGAIWVQSVTATNVWTSGLSGTFTATATTTTLTFTFSCNEYLTVGFTNIGVSAVCEAAPQDTGGSGSTRPQLATIGGTGANSSGFRSRNRGTNNDNDGLDYVELKSFGGSAGSNSHIGDSSSNSFNSSSDGAAYHTSRSPATTRQADPGNSSQEGLVDELRRANGGVVNVTVSSGRPNVAGNGSGSNTPGGIVVTNTHVLQRVEGNDYAGYVV
ncbi:hypothetical protein Sste5346_008771 [Sporothrix stenoceras]|uniref:CBM-cenC domain-containing protein n=1 Tax=Sporothrix stenoceras TaxID=5173 RepID=A0ABR3YNG9_9PEZI